MAVHVAFAQLSPLKTLSDLQGPLSLRFMRLIPNNALKTKGTQDDFGNTAECPTCKHHKLQAPIMVDLKHYGTEGSSMRLLTKVLPLTSFVVAIMKSYFIPS